MDEHLSPAQRSAQNKKTALGALFLFLRLLAASLIGWFVPWFFFQSSYSPFSFLLVLHIDAAFPLILLFPLIIGIGAPLTVGKQNQYLIVLSIGMGLLVLAGVAAYASPLATAADAKSNAYCAVHECHVGGIEAAVLTFYLLYGVVLMLISTGITCFIIKRIRKKSAEDITASSVCLVNADQPDR
jgi:hypothetical protein